MRLFSCTLACCLVTLTSATTVSASTKKLDALLKSIDQIRVEEGISAVTLSILQEKGDWSGGLGTLSHDSKEPATADTLIRVGSITKAFTSLATLKLAEEGKLQLRDPLSKWVSSDLYKNSWEDHRPITLEQLLEHTAGFRDISKAEFDFNDPGLIPLQKNLKRFKASHVTHWLPGAHSSYSNLGAGFVGLALEKATASTYEQLLEDLVLKPLAMNESSFVIDETKQLHLMKGYDTDGKTPIPYWHMVYRPFGGLNSTSRDMSKFVRMLIERGVMDGKRVFERESIVRMETPTTTLAARHGLRYGYGLGVYHWLRKGVLFQGHGGDADGYLSRFGYTLENNSGYFVVINAFNHSALNKIRRLIEEYLSQDLPKAVYPSPHSLKSESLTRLLGRYESATSRFGRTSPSMQIASNKGTVYTKIGSDEPSELIPVSDSTFRRLNETVATIAIVPDKEGLLVYQDDQYNFVKTARD